MVVFCFSKKRCDGLVDGLGSLDLTSAEDKSDIQATSPPSLPKIVSLHHGKWVTLLCMSVCVGQGGQQAWESAYFLKHASRVVRVLVHSSDLDGRRHMQVFCNKALARLRAEDRGLPQIKRLQSLLRRGLGIHHAGAVLTPFWRPVRAACIVHESHSPLRPMFSNSLPHRSLGPCLQGSEAPRISEADVCCKFLKQLTC